MSPPEVWIARVGDPLPPDCRSWLDEDERQRLDRFGVAAEQERRLTAWCLRRHALSRRHPEVAPSEWRFIRTAAGKPRLAPPFETFALEHNLSHGGGYAAFVLSEQACGVDVEQVRSGLADLINALGPEEIADIRSSAAPDDRFLLHWVAKEAVLKMAGTGLTCSPRAVSVRIGRGEEVTVTLSPPLPLSLAHRLRIATWRLDDGHRLAVAFHSPDPATRPHLRELIAQQ